MLSTFDSGSLNLFGNFASFNNSNPFLLASIFSCPKPAFLRGASIHVYLFSRLFLHAPATGICDGFEDRHAQKIDTMQNRHEFMKNRHG